MLEASAVLDCFDDLTTFEKEMILEKMNQVDFVPSTITPASESVSLKDEIKKLNGEISNVIDEKRKEEDKIIQMNKVQEDEESARKFLE